MTTSTSPLSRRSLAEQVADALVELIFSEGLEEGDSLPSTAELSEKYEVSRTVIREALAALAGRGVLTRSQGREPVVATPNATDLSNLLSLRVRRDDVSLLNIIDARYGLEVMAAQLAAAHATPEQLADMDAELASLAAAKREADFHRADIRLHRAVAVASGNPLIVMMLDALGEFLMDFRVKATRHRKSRGETQEPVVEQHRRIVEAVRSGDPVRARDAMSAHLAASRAEVE